MFPGEWGRWLGFLFVFQLCFSAPLSVASGAIGLAQYAGFVWPALSSHAGPHVVHAGAYSFGVHAGRSVVLAMVIVALAALLQMRRAGELKRLSYVLLGLVLLTIVWTVLTGVLRGHWGNVVAFAPGAWTLNSSFFLGLGSAMLVATYDYWGYYNVTFLGAEVREAARTIPRAVLGSIAIVAVLYLALNASVLSVLGAPAMMQASSLGARRALLSVFMESAWTPVLGGYGVLLAKLAAVLVMVTAFASVFSLLLGYSRVPYAAASDGNFLRAFARLDRRGGFPLVSLLSLAAMAMACCFLSLSDVIAALVVLRIVLQFGMQHAGVMLWRKRKPELVRPFRMWLYPLPPLLALVGFGYIVFSRPNFKRELALAGVVSLAGTIVFLLRKRKDGQ